MEISGLLLSSLRVAATIFFIAFGCGKRPATNSLLVKTFTGHLTGLDCKRAGSKADPSCR